MSKSTTLDLIQLLASSQADATAISNFYDDVIFDLGRLPLVTDVSLQAVTAGDSSYAYPSDAVQLLQLMYDDRELYEMAHNDLGSVSQFWRDKDGPPNVYTKDDTARSVLLHPNPDAPSDSFSGTPLGSTYPVGALVFLFTENRSDTLAWLELLIALEVLAREFTRESDHKDLNFAASAREISRILLSVVV